jgi:hypothetical protein
MIISEPVQTAVWYPLKEGPPTIETALHVFNDGL